MSRIFLYNKDVQAFTGRSEKYARTLMGKIRAQYGKPQELPITIYEFCKYLKIETDVVLKNLR